MKYIVEVLALLILGAIAATAVLIFGRPSVKVAQGELRCEGAGAVIIRIAGEDYAVNTLAGWQFPPVQIVWNKDTFPETNIDRLIVKGLTLCDWHTAAKRSEARGRGWLLASLGDSPRAPQGHGVLSA